MNKDQVRRYTEKLQHAEDILNDLFWEMQDERGFSKEVKRLDTILGKVYDLKHQVYHKAE